MSAFSANSNNMRETANDIAAKEVAYANTVSEIEAQINHLGQLWNSPVYDQFKQLFNEKLPSLNEGDQLMKEFKQRLERAADSFDEAQRNIMSNFN